MRTLQFSVSGQKLSTAGDHSGLRAGTNARGKNQQPRNNNRRIKVRIK